MTSLFETSSLNCGNDKLLERGHDSGATTTHRGRRSKHHHEAADISGCQATRLHEYRISRPPCNSRFPYSIHAASITALGA
jgi:hypothetical protein